MQIFSFSFLFLVDYSGTVHKFRLGVSLPSMGTNLLLARAILRPVLVHLKLVSLMMVGWELNKLARTSRSVTVSGRYNFDNNNKKVWLP